MLDADADTIPEAATRPLSLSDDQMSTIFAAAEPLPPADRSAFLRDVAMALQGREIGDGLVARVCAEMQRRYLVPPDLARSKDCSRWRS